MQYLPLAIALSLLQILVAFVLDKDGMNPDKRR